MRLTKSVNLKKTKLHTYFSAISLLCFSPFLFAAADSPQDAVFTALETNPEVQIRWHTFQSSGFDTREARGAYYPSVDVSAGTGIQDREFDGRGSYDINMAEISLTQMLFDGFRTRSDVERLETAQQVRLFELLGSVDSTALEAVRAYDDVLRHRLLLDLVRENYDQHLIIESQIREQVGQGIGRGADLDQVVGRVALTESNLLAEAANLHDVTSRYLRVVGELPSDDASPLQIRYPSLPDAVNDMLYAAYQGNSDFHAAIKNISVQQAAVDVDRSAYYPRVELRARTGSMQNIGFFDERFDGNDFGSESRVELAFTYNLYRGGSDKAAINSSLALVDEARSLRDQACINLRQVVQISYNDTQRIEERLVALRLHRDSIDSVRFAYAEQFEIGQRTLLDVLDSENEFFQASIDLLNTEHELTMAHAELLAATGKLLPELNISRSQLMFLGDNADLASIDVEPSAACPAVSPKSFGIDDLVVASFTMQTDVLFDTDKSTLTSVASTMLDKMIADLKDVEGVLNITIDAHADNSGLEAKNVPLSQARARSVRDYINLNSDRADFIVVNGFGSSMPVASNATAEGRKLNRRVEITASQTGHSKEIESYVGL